MTARRSILAAIGMVALVLAPAAAAQEEGRWVSPTYGFSVSWDPAEWQEEPSEALVAEGPDELDRLLLLGDIGPLYIEGVRRYDGVASTCVSSELEAIENEPDISDGTRLPEYDADGPDASAGAIEATLTRDSGDEVQVIAYIQCVRAGADSVAIGTLLAPVSEFPDHLERAQSVLASVAPAAAAAGSATEFASLLEAARANEPLVSSDAGSLAFGPGVMATEETGVNVADFAASATFANPYDGADQPFDFGFAFRHSGLDQHFRLVIDSMGAWALQNGLETVASGSVAGVRSGAGESNTLEIVARGAQGWFAVNGEYGGALDLSGRSDAGDLLAAAGFFSENATVEGVTRFSRLSIWPFAAQAVDGAGEDDAASLRGMIDLASAEAAAAGPLSGVLVESEGEVSLEPAGVFLADFAARARWLNPEETGPWEIGLAFRDQPDGSHYRLTFTQDGRWMFGIGTGEKALTGTVPSMRLGPGEQNSLEIAVVADTAWFSVNGEYVARLDVSEIMSEGDVWFGAGFDSAATEPGRETRYRDFTVWPIAGMSPGVETPEGDDLVPLPPLDEETGSGADAEAGALFAVRVAEVDGSGVSGLATVSDVQGEAYLNLVLRGGNPGALAVIHEGTCSDLSLEPAFLLEDVDEGGRSKSALGVPVNALLETPLAIAVYADIDSYGAPVACGDIR